MFTTFTVGLRLHVVVFTRAEDTNGIEAKWRFYTCRTQSLSHKHYYNSKYVESCWVFELGGNITIITKSGNI